MKIKRKIKGKINNELKKERDRQTDCKEAKPKKSAIRNNSMYAFMLMVHPAV